MILVASPDVTALNAFKDDPESADLHPLRESGSKNYLWWAHDTPRRLGVALRPRYPTKRW